MSSSIQPEALLPHHLELLKNSAISPEVVAARGYRSAQTRAELRRLGFSEVQTRVPALLIPIWGVHGEIVLYQARPDEPRICHGKPVKYETPRGARMVLDVPPGGRQGLADPIRPLFITEGVRKADAAVSRGLCCVDLLGVWSWRGTNELGGKTALADWELIALNERPAYIVFDSDVMQKTEVNAALVRLKAFFESRGAKVAVIYLPPGAGGEKVGLDDYLVAGHSVDELLSLASSEIKRVVENVADSAGPYQIENGRICYVKETTDGPVTVPLCNFSARVAEEVILDDGFETRPDFVIEGTLDNGRPLPPVRVPADRYDGMSWVTRSWGRAPVIAAGFAARDRIREAILRFSTDAGRRRVFTHTGWRLIDGVWRYLTASGAVGADGFEVELGPELSRYSLPRVAEDPTGAMRVSLDLLWIAPLHVTAPLLAGVFRAPLASACALDLSLWLVGQTGEMKSTLAALAQSHWGEFDRTNLPGSWSSTVNALERRAFLLKDTMFVIDDFAPSAHDRRELETKASRLIRAQGNLAGRGRLRADLSERPAYPPQGLIVGSAEQRPPGQSILARTYLIQPRRDAVNMTLLTTAQRQAARLPHAMAGYVSWLAPQMGSLPPLLRRTFEETRSRAVGVAPHLRIPEGIAHLWLGLDCALAYAEEVGACSPVRAGEIRQQSWAALVEGAKAQGQVVEEARPALRFLQILATVVSQKRATLLSAASASDHVRIDAPLVGWHDAQHLYLLPEAAFQVVVRFARDSDEPFPVSEGRLRQDLVREGISKPDPDRLTASVRIGPSTRRVLRLRRTAIDAVLGENFPVPSPVVTADTGSEE